MRKLTLRSEALAELTADELTAVAGATWFLTEACVSQRCTGVMCLFSDNGPLCLEG